MSKFVLVKATSQNLVKTEFPAERDVSQTLVAYKDLNQNSELQLQKQRYHLYSAFCVFLLMGLFILGLKVISKPRTVASSQVGFEVQGVHTHVELEQYDKSCYTGEKGEPVCLTRTSRK